MSEQWTYFLNSLPSDMKNYALQHVKEVNDFQLNDNLNMDEQALSFISPSTRIEVHFFRTLLATSLSIWYPDAEKNNSEGDPSVTDNEFYIRTPFANLKDIA